MTLSNGILVGVLLTLLVEFFTVLLCEIHTVRKGMT